MEDVIDAALRFLSYRPRSEAEVRRRLSRRFPPHMVDRAVGDLKKRGLLDDAAFARFWLGSRERHRPRGASAIRWELLRLGVPREVVDEALEGLDEENNAYQAAIKVLHRLARPDLVTFRKKLFPYLRRRGFGAYAINRTVQRLWSELSHPPDGGEVANDNGQQQEDVAKQKDPSEDSADYHC